MPPGGDAVPFVGVNWSSSAFRACLIHPVHGLIDEVVSADGVATTGRDDMARLASGLLEKWSAARAIYAAGMIGSNLGWVEVPYVEAPARAETLADALVRVNIGKAQVAIVPGVACRRSVDGEPDVMRGEEVELLGLAQLDGVRDEWVVLPGTHTKWAKLTNGMLSEFFTSMSGEIFERLTTQGLLASVVDGPAEPGKALNDGLAYGTRGGLSLGTLLFGARGRAMRGLLDRKDAASFIKGLLIAGEMADARRLLGLSDANSITIVGNETSCALYASALAWNDLDDRVVDSRAACATGFIAIDAAVRR